MGMPRADYPPTRSSRRRWELCWFLRLPEGINRWLQDQRRCRRPTPPAAALPRLEIVEDRSFPNLFLGLAPVLGAGLACLAVPAIARADAPSDLLIGGHADDRAASGPDVPSAVVMPTLSQGPPTWAVQPSVDLDRIDQVFSSRLLAWDDTIHADTALAPSAGATASSEDGGSQPAAPADSAAPAASEADGNGGSTPPLQAGGWSASAGMASQAGLAGAVPNVIGGTPGAAAAGTAHGASSGDTAVPSGAAATIPTTGVTPAAAANAAPTDSAWAAGNHKITPLTGQASSTSVTSSVNPSVSGQAVTFTATVLGNTDGGRTPSGTVTFYDGSNVLGTAPVSGARNSGIARASLTTSSLPVGTDAITAVYSGDSTYEGSSGSMTQTVNKAATGLSVSATPSSPVYGQAVTFTASVSAVAPGSGTPTGTVSFTADGTTSLGSASLSNGSASLTYAGLSAGTHTIAATYSGDGNFSPSSGNVSETVGQAGTSTAVTAAPNPTISGHSVTFTATVTATAPGAGTPSGTVTFSSGGNAIGTASLSSGTAALSYSGLPVGSDTVTAAYSGDGNFAGSSGTTTETINVATASSTSVSASPNPSQYGQSVTFTATVSGAGGTPTGTVTFSSGGNTLGTASLSGGTASLSSSALPIGSDSVTASYSGDNVFGPSQGTVTETVNKVSTTTSVSPAPNPSVSGQSVTFTATVSAAGGGTPTGTVAFRLDGGTPTSEALSGGTASYAVSGLSVGAHTITASYSGDATFAASSGSASATVNQSGSTTSLTAAPSPSTCGQTVTFTTIVSATAPGSGTPTGSVTYYDGNNVLGTASLVNGTATLSTAALAAGSHTITADYSGDADFQPSSNEVTQVVNQAATATTLSAAPDPSVLGQPVVLSAVVSVLAPGGGTPTGTVTFSSSGGTLGTVSLSGSTATLVTTALPVGTDTITASYSGDANYQPSSGSTSQTVNPDALSSPPPPMPVGGGSGTGSPVPGNPPSGGGPPSPVGSSGLGGLVTDGGLPGGGAATPYGSSSGAGDVVGIAEGDGGNLPDPFSAAGVRYFDGSVDVAATDLASEGFGTPWGQTRSFSNSAAYQSANIVGNGWVLSQMPTLVQPNATTVVLLSNATTSRYYNLVGGAWQPEFFDQTSLVDNTAAGQFTLTDENGDRIVFWDFSSAAPAAQQGKLVSWTDPAGNTITVTAYTPGGDLGEVQRSTTSGGNTITESYLYTYLGSGPNAGLLQSVTLRRQTNGGGWGTVRQVQYAYYDGTGPHGNRGDLKTATIQDAAGNTLDTYYYRYYTTDDASGGYTGGLKYVFNPDAYARLAAAYSNAFSATDAQAAPYADASYQYDSQHRTTQATVAGLGTYSYTYTASSNPAGVNSWAEKTTETLPDGNTNVVYSNAYGEAMLGVHQDAGTGQSWDNFFEYDSQGRLLVQANPSAVTGYNEADADLLNNQNGSYQYLSSNSGLLTRYDYYNGTSAGESTAGGVAGYEQDVALQQGQQGTPIRQESWQYYQHAAYGSSVDPLAADTLYRNSDGSGAETTSYAYTWYSGTASVQQETQTLPTISASQNGPGSADVQTIVYDTYGQPVWTKDSDGYLTYRAYDPATGGVTETIDDVNTAYTGDYSNLPSGWSTPTGGGLNLVTSYAVDALGRPVTKVSPNGNVTYVVYDDVDHELRIYAGWNAGTLQPTGPTEVERYDRSNSYLEVLTMSAAPHTTNGVPDGTEAISGLQTLSRVYVNAAGQEFARDDYFNLAGLAYTAAAMGAAGVHFNQTLESYDNRGRLNRVQTPTGTVYRTVYDGLGRDVSDWVGTNDTPASGTWSPSNPAGMYQVDASQYDHGGVGDGNRTASLVYPGGSAPVEVTDYWYDWRDRPVARKAGVQTPEDTTTGRPLVYTTYDNLDQVVQVQQYDGDGVTLSTVNGVPQAPDASRLRAQEDLSYDDQGRIYQSQVYDVNPTTGAVSSNALTTNDYYDHRGNLVAESAPGGLWSKAQFDGAGREVMDYTTDGAGGSSWAAATSVANDHVLEQTQTVYDGDGNAIETITKQRFHNETATGALGNPTTGPLTRVYYAAAYYDAADRLTTTVDAGTNGGTAWTRPATAPASSATLLVSSYGYNAAGWLQDSVDPLGIDRRTLYDNLGEVTQTIANYTGAAETATSDVATQYAYDGDGHLVLVQADQPGGAAQQTRYVYGVSPATGSVLSSNDILAAVQHPDPSTGQASAAQQEGYVVNGLGQVTQYSDRNGSVHNYSYDVLGRLSADAVTTLAAGVNGSVRRIEYGYDSQGNVSLITSFDAATGGNIVNQVQRQYNGLGQLTGDYQSHSGAVNTSSTPAVQYAYTELSAGNNSRLVSMTYPNGRVLNFNYNPGLDSSISRLSSLSDSSGTLESYQYLGLGTVVERDHPQTGVNLTYLQQGNDPNASHDGGDQYVGLDRFGRVIDQNWYNATTQTSTDRFQYGYDADSNILYKNNLVLPGNSELYSYNALNEVSQLQRGTLNSSKTGMASLAYRESWSLDALGNFTQVSTQPQSDAGPQTETFNQQNEITSISNSGAVTYDANGNLTADGSGKQYTYDAWNRLVAVTSGGSTLAQYGYDGLGRRITETHGSTTTDLYYNAGWQVVEERQGGLVQAQNVWSPMGIDTLVLRDQSTQHNGVLDQRLYVQQDTDGNVTAVTDANGNVLERYQYDPYGAVTFLGPDGSGRAGSSVGAVYLWQGKRLDAATGTYDQRERVYLPSLGRSLQADPLGLGPDVNYYRWEGDNPTNGADPSGLWNLWNPLTWGTGNPDSDRWYNKINPFGESAHWGATAEGVGQGACNIARGTAKVGKEAVLATVDVGNSALATVSGERFGYQGYLSELGNALQSGQLSVTEYYKQMALNLASLGTAAEVQAFIQYCKGEITANEASERIGSAGLLQLLQARAMAKARAVNANRAQGPAPRALKSCFPPGTLVHTSVGVKAIECVKPGDRVWAYDLRHLHWAEREVVEVYQLQHHGTMATLRIKGETLRATGGHPFWVIRGECLAERPKPVRIPAYEPTGRQEGRWVLARDLRTGDELLLRQGEIATVQSVQLDEVAEQVHNFHVADLQNYAVGSCGVLVHNTNDATTPTPGIPQPTGSPGGATSQSPLGGPTGAVPPGPATGAVPLALTELEAQEARVAAELAAMRAQNAASDAIDLGLDASIQVWQKRLNGIRAQINRLRGYRRNP